MRRDCVDAAGYATHHPVTHLHRRRAELPPDIAGGHVECNAAALLEFHVAYRSGAQGLGVLDLVETTRFDPPALALFNLPALVTGLLAAGLATHRFLGVTRTNEQQQREYQWCAQNQLVHLVSLGMKLNRRSGPSLPREPLNNQRFPSDPLVT